MASTTRARDHFDLDNLERRVQEGLISKSVRNDLSLYNYSPLAQYSDTWDREIRASRGLVLTSDGYIQSRPLAKFFNLDQHGVGSVEPLPVEPFDVYEKIDGSMIAASTTDDGVLLTTRGSFQSDQAVAAAELWAMRFNDVQIPVGETWCFEFVAPWNRIVVPFDDENLILLACLSNETGLDCHNIETVGWPGDTARRFDGLDLATIRAALPNLPHDEEGYVLRFRSGVRAKAKGDAYLAIHRIVTGLSTRTVHEALASGTFDDLIANVPDEFHPWVRGVSARLTEEFDTILMAVEVDLIDSRHAAGPFYNRREFAEKVKQTSFPGLCFAMEDGKDISPRIWQMIRPERSTAMILDTTNANDNQGDTK